MSSYLDAYVARFENMPGFTLYSVTPDGKLARPWFKVEPTDVVRSLVIDETNLGNQVQVVTAEIQKWGRFIAQAKRVWELQERGYRAWRSQFFLDANTAPDGDDEKPGWTRTAKGEPKGPSISTVEALYRTAPEYHSWQILVEEAEEVFNSVTSIYEAFKAQRDMLKHFAYRNRDSGEAQLAI